MFLLALWFDFLRPVLREGRAGDFPLHHMNLKRIPYLLSSAVMLCRWSIRSVLNTIVNNQVK